MSKKRLFIISNRLPINITGDEEEMEVKTSTGGLITAIDSYLQNDQEEYSEIFWAGVPGCNPAVWKNAERSIPQEEYTYLPVMIYKEQYEKYYNGFSNSVLWPLFHYFPSYAEYEEDCFEQYLQVNEHFADMLARHLRPDDTIWIHDYHLLPLAAMLRKEFPELTIGFFLHIPFPSYELFRMMPKKWQEQLLNGMLGADLIGFHTIDYATHFLQSVQMIIGLDHDRHILRFNNRLVKVDVFPISIDYQRFNDAFNQESVIQKRQNLIDKLGDRKIIFSVDRLDYTKGVQNRLKAYENFLLSHPEYHNKVVFIMVIVPSRDTIPKYVERKKIIDEMISSINSKIGNLHWQPLIYQYNYLQFDEMIALYTSCDLALITPLRDGMNLVAKEFVASRMDHKGVLVISELAGAARELTDALTINPNDIVEMSDKIKEGLEMDLLEQSHRLKRMQRRISNYDVQAWADDFMSGLQSIKQKQQSFQIKFLDEFSKRNLFDAYRIAEKRLLLLDYDGTLVSFNSNPELAIPGPELVKLLGKICNSEENDVFLISGRKSEWLEKEFGSLPINLISEHGAKCKWKNQAWKTQVQTHSEWKSQVHNIMEMYVRRCAHSFIEEKEFSIVWHYRNASTDHGKLRALELMSELNDYIHNCNLQVMMGNKIVEVRNSGIDKGTAIKKILSGKSYDFIFAVGDDRTDEDMFRFLVQKKNSYTIKVGSTASFAQYNLYTPQMVISLLHGMSQLNKLKGLKQL